MLHNRRVSISRLLGLDDGIGKKEWRPDEKMEGEKVFVALPELFVFSHVSFFLFFYVTLAENVFDLILGWVYFGFGSLNGLTVFLESECSFCFDNEISERLPLLSTSFHKIESHQIVIFFFVWWGLLWIVIVVPPVFTDDRGTRKNATMEFAWVLFLCVFGLIGFQLGRYGLSVVHGPCSSLPSPTVQDQHIIVTTSSALQSTSFYYSETSYSTVRRSQASTTPPPTRQFSSLAGNSTSGEV